MGWDGMGWVGLVPFFLFIGVASLCDFFPFLFKVFGMGINILHGVPSIRWGV